MRYVCAVALCFPNILDVMVLENVNLSSDRNWVTLLWSNDKDLDFCHLSVIYTVSSVYFNCTLISYAVFISVRKLHALPYILCYELNSVHVNPLISKGDDSIYFVIIVISSVFVIILQHL
jgi:hypothetical protein